MISKCHSHSHSAVVFDFDNTLTCRLQNLPVTKTGFSLRSVLYREKPLNSNENRFFPVKKPSQGEPCFHYRFFPVKVCSDTKVSQTSTMTMTLTLSKTYKISPLVDSMYYQTRFSKCNMYVSCAQKCNVPACDVRSLQI